MSLKKLFLNVWIQCLVVTAVAVLLYINTLPNSLVWDDRDFIKDWSATRSLSNIPKFFQGESPGPHKSKYRPLRGVILSFDYYFFKTNPVGYHIQAIIIHSIASILVLLIIRQILESKIIALTAAILFAAHPIHTEAITFITSSIDIVGIDLALGSIYIYLLYSKEVKVGKRLALLLVSLILATLGFFSNEIALIVPLLIIIYHFCFPDNILSLKQKSFGLTIFFLVISIYVFIRLSILNLPASSGYFLNSFSKSLLIMPVVFFKYLSLLIVPIYLNVNHRITEGVIAFHQSEHQATAIPNIAIKNPEILYPGLGIILLFLLFFLIRKHFSYIAFCIGWIFVSFLPVANLIPIPSLLEERYFYLASFGFCLLLAIFLGRIYKLNSLLALVMFLVLVVFYSKTTIARNLEWRSELSLWDSSAKLTPESITAHANLAGVYITDNNLHKAQEEVDIANDLAKRNKINYANIYRIQGIINFKKGHFLDAKDKFQSIIKARLDDYISYYYLGLIDENQNKLNLAQQNLERSVQLNPIYESSKLALGEVYYKRYEFEKAEQLTKQSIDLDNSNPKSYVLLGKIYLKMGLVGKAIESYQKALELDPGNIVRSELDKLTQKDNGKQQH